MTRRWALRVRSKAGLAGVLALMLLPGFDARAQFPPPGPGGPAGPPRDTAPFDMTGYWVAIVNEDWRWRMVTPPKGDYTSINMLSQRGRALADQWDPSQDGSCKAYGAPALLRMPTRLHIAWQSDDVLRLETDAGAQTRTLRFAVTGPRAVGPAGAGPGPGTGASPPPDAPLATGPPGLQGTSVAEWQRPLRPPGRPVPGAAPPQGGSLRVTTTNLLPGWLRRNGVPYSDQTTVTEYFDQFEAPNGSEWLVVTTIVEDPVYLTGRYVTSSHFRREPDDANWSPRPCSGD